MRHSPPAARLGGAWTFRLLLAAVAFVALGPPAFAKKRKRPAPPPVEEPVRPPEPEPAAPQEDATPPPPAPAPPPPAPPEPASAPEDIEASAPPPAFPEWLWRAYPAIAGPPLHGLVPQTRLYLDGSVVRSRDLSALPYIAGSGVNARTALGGSWSRGGFQLSGDITFAQATRIHVTQVPGGMPIPEDETQTATSLGDTELAASYTHVFAAWPLALGGALRARIPTHTTIFQFHLIDGSLGRYPFPYYFHIEPTLLLATGWGPLSLVVNQGPLVLMGPDGNFQELHIVVPTLWFWDSHVALALALGRMLGLSVELVSTFLTSHIDQPEFAQLNGLTALSLNPAISLRFERVQLDLVARFGLNKGAEAFGVVVFSGTEGLLLRASLFFP